jgi:hypothetical protein
MEAAIAVWIILSSLALTCALVFYLNRKLRLRWIRDPAHGTGRVLDVATRIVLFGLLFFFAEPTLVGVQITLAEALGILD